MRALLIEPISGVHKQASIVQYIYIYGAFISSSQFKRNSKISDHGLNWVMDDEEDEEIYHQDIPLYMTTLKSHRKIHKGRLKSNENCLLSTQSTT